MGSTVDYLVTGGAGFIGSNVTSYLAASGKSVRVFDNYQTGKRENLASLKGKVEIIEGDLRNIDEVKNAVTDARYILHMGALPSVPRSVEQPIEANEINVSGTLNLLLAARDAHCQRVVLSSSSSVYGDTPTLPKYEGMTPSPLSPYAIHKITGEYYCKVFWQLFGLETVSLRYFNVFGPQQDPESQYAAVIPKFITSILNDQSPTIFGDGQQSRDFSYVENVIRANLAACEASKDALGESFNIAGGGRITLLELAETINDILGKSIKPEHISPRAGDVLHSQADIAKAAKFLNWKPSVSFREGLEKTIEWYRTKI